ISQRQVDMDIVEGYRAEGYVKEFIRHSTDVLLNLNELRHRNILTDATLVVGSHHLQAHCAVLVACSGFFYSLYSSRTFIPSGSKEQLLSVVLPSTLDPSSVSLLLDFMYTSRLPLTPSIAPGVLAVATYLQMDHVAETCRQFMQKNMSSRPPQLELASRVFVASAASREGFLPHAGQQLKLPVTGQDRGPVEGGDSLKPGVFPTGRSETNELNVDADTVMSPDSPARSNCQPNSPAESNTCSKNLSDSRTLDPKACNWKKYKYIILNPLFTDTTVKEEETCQTQSPNVEDRAGPTLKTPVEAWPGEVPGVSNQPLIKRETYFVPYCYSGVTKTTCSGEKPYRCNVCGAQFNRPANLKTHTRIHSGEKPYRCDTCGARFVQVAHLRAHVLIHTGEKPYPCHTCGTRFRHLQTLKSHLRIHTGEKPYTCEKCDLHFRHKSQLRLHLRQKHGAITNTKIRYKILSEPCQRLLQAC
uniref:BCL6B transcription repressor n=1 Tax=Neogobius melanostomus TaxID=47308 RepID=A0A8C6TJR5_9GOBI